MAVTIYIHLDFLRILLYNTPWELLYA